MPNTDHAKLVESPPSESEVLNASYSGGLAMLCGVPMPAGGYLVGVDVDRGPESWPAWPRGTVLAEHGTATGKWHLFIVTSDQLQGQRVIFEGTYETFMRRRRDKEKQAIIAEFKGVRFSLRSWPTQPPDKPRGYRSAYIAEDPPEPVLSSQGLIESMSDFFERGLGWTVYVKGDAPTTARATPATDRFARAIEDALAAQGTTLSAPRGASQWQDGLCPFHHDTHKSFSLSFTVGRFMCRTPGCKGGSLHRLARELGVRVPSKYEGLEVRG